MMQCALSSTSPKTGFRTAFDSQIQEVPEPVRKCYWAMSDDWYLEQVIS